MKATNNLNMDLKEEIETLNTEVGKLRIFKDDFDEMKKELVRGLEKDRDDQLEVKDEELKSMQRELDSANRELKEMK